MPYFEENHQQIFGEHFCRLISNQFHGKHLRTNLNKSDDLNRELIRLIIIDNNNLENNLLSQNFWQNILDVLDSKFTHQHSSIRKMFSWQELAKKFFLDIHPNYSSLKLNKDFVQFFQTTIEKLLSKNKQTSVDGLLKLLFGDIVVGDDEDDDDGEQILSTSNRSITNIDDDDEDQPSDLEISINDEPPEEQNQIDKNQNDIQIDIAVDDDDQMEVNVIDRQNTNANDDSSTSSISDIEDIQPVEPKSTNIDQQRKKTSTPRKKLQLNDEDDDNDSVSNVFDRKQKPKSKQIIRKKIKLNQIPENESSDTDINDIDERFEMEFNNRDSNNEPERDIQSIKREIYSIIAPKSYTMEEDGSILKFIIKTGRYREIKGRSLWEDMERNRICNRTWQSMKERFRKIITPKLPLYTILFNLSEKEVENFYLYSMKKMPQSSNDSSNISKRSNR
ncbi:hypothetical protein DERP_007876 [Dermatophagoides pteronyssinus]|uniref:Telomeric repeat-binding factor 2-interacting protein 1 n=1 Tax=Dermatophagoides pteronyssinus TaxID=6956 RepID=A0ABQ8ITK1_DERPT|nr:hypothetical protein DERP_007876 [Dermatophagoides pteronyssinus]